MHPQETLTDCELYLLGIFSVIILINRTADRGVNSLRTPRNRTSFNVRIRHSTPRIASAPARVLLDVHRCRTTRIRTPRRATCVTPHAIVVSAPRIMNAIPARRPQPPTTMRVSADPIVLLVSFPTAPPTHVRGVTRAAPNAWTEPRRTARRATTSTTWMVRRVRRHVQLVSSPTMQRICVLHVIPP